MNTHHPEFLYTLGPFRIFAVNGRSLGSRVVSISSGRKNRGAVTSVHMLLCFFTSVLELAELVRVEGYRDQQVPERMKGGGFP